MLRAQSGKGKMRTQSESSCSRSGKGELARLLGSSYKRCSGVSSKPSKWQHTAMLLEAHPYLHGPRIWLEYLEPLIDKTVGTTSQFDDVKHSDRERSQGSYSMGCAQQ
ncbi:unnamed protein product [Mortierella alpina]